MQKRKKLTYLLINTGLVLALLVGCGGQPISPLKLPVAKAITGKTIDEDFINDTADYALKIFQKSHSKEANTMVSPLSLLIALAMSANGAEGETREEMERLFGQVDIAELNTYLVTYLTLLRKAGNLKIANSLWVRDSDNIVVLDDFLQVVADIYQAEIYQEKFDEETVKAINKWTEKNTDGLIKEIIQDLDPLTVLCLLNAIVFEAKWAEVYTKEQIREREFNNYKNEKENVDFMFSEESYYLSDGQASGFIKYYQDYQYAFVALLPKEGLSVSDYLSGLKGKDLINTINNAREASVYAGLPKFSYDTELEMNDILKSMGMVRAFDDNKAQFGKLLDLSSLDNVFISKVIHKTQITVDELGTKAGAVTAVLIDAKSAPLENHEVILDRPFVYLIIDNETKLPIFIGTVLTTK